MAKGSLRITRLGSVALALFQVILVLSACFVAAASASLCCGVPVCAHSEQYGLLFRARYCWSSSLPFSTPHAAALKSPAFSDTLLPNLHEALVELQGQPGAVRQILALVERKLKHIQEPLVLHLVGPHGVGKSLAAQLISLAWSLHCGSSHASAASARRDCRQGDALHVISGSSYDGLPPRNATDLILRGVVQHGRRFPHGIVLVDDIAAMNAEVQRSLMRFFLTNATSLLVLTTADTEVGRAPSTDAVEPDTNEVDVVFYALSRQSLAAIVREAVAYVPCRDQRVRSATITDEAVAWVLDSTPSFQTESGHALRRSLEDVVFPTVHAALLACPLDVDIGDLTLFTQPHPQLPTGQGSERSLAWRATGCSDGDYPEL